jgi:hypothetical protein
MPKSAPPPNDLARLRKNADFNGSPILTLLCMGIMLAFGLVPIVLAVQMSLRAQRWVETPIEIVGAGERVSESGDLRSVVREAVVRYRYRFGRFTYSSDRIGVHLQAADNMGGWQKNWAERIRSGQPLTAWVDPAHPDQAVLDRSLRPGLILFHACFAVVVWPMYVAGRALVARWRLRRRAR